MKGGRLSLKGALVGLSLCWAAPGLVGVVAALAAPGSAPAFVAARAEGVDPWHVAAASVGLVLAAAALAFGARRSAAAAIVLGAAVVLVSVVPEARPRAIPAAGDPPGATPASAPDGTRPSETLVYARPGGEELRLDVWEPSSADAPARAGGRSAVVMVHGGGWHTGSRGGMPAWSDWFAEEGHVVFDIDYRLAPQARWRSAPGDVRCAVGWVKANAARYGVDPERVVLVGYSAGGHLALLSAFSGNDGPVPAGCGRADPGVAAVAAFYPPTDLTRLHDMEWPWARPNVVGLHSTTGFLGGTPEGLPGRFRAASPANHVDPEDPPTLLVHGLEDRVVPFEQSGLLAVRLGAAGVPHRLLGVPGAGHSFDHVSERSWEEPGTLTARRALSEFLRFSLGSQDGPRDEQPKVAG